MTVFDRIMQQVLEIEGGYVDNPSDPGGKTKFGISQRAFPHLNIIALTESQASAIYKKHYWDPYPFFEKINAPLVVLKLFVAGINMGQKYANICLQRALRSFKHVDADGIIGPKSLETINSVPANELVPAFNSECAGRYRMLCAKNSSLKKFLNGWLNRAYMRFPSFV